jgi:protein TonB
MDSGAGVPSADNASAVGGPGAGAASETSSGADGTRSSSAAEASGISAPRPLAAIQPVYPRAARRAGWQGVVRIRALVGITGNVASAEVAQSSGHAILDEAALEAVRLTVFAPAEQAGKAVASLVIIPVRFQLN